MEQFTLAEFAKNSENKEGSTFTPAVQEEGIEQGTLIVSRLYNTMLGEITKSLKSWNLELTKILTEAGITPSGLSNEQLYTAITKMINQSSGHMIGELVSSVLPISSAGLHLLDGYLITGDGVYAEFVEYIAGLYNSSSPAPAYFTTESAWQSSVSQYGSCGKFVYDAANNTVRLPKISNIVEGTTDVTALGALIKAGLPNHFHIFGNNNGNNAGNFVASNQAVTAPNPDITEGSGYRNWNGSGGGGSYGRDTDTSTGNMITAVGRSCTEKSGATEDTILGTTNTVQPQTIKVLVYIALTQAPRTDIQIDVDNIITELNGKVDKSSLEEVHCVIETYTNGSFWYRLYDDGWCEQGGKIIGSNETDVTFLQEFKDTNYSLNIQQISLGSTSASYFGAMKAYALTTEGFHYKSGQSENPDVSWTACGYIN